MQISIITATFNSAKTIAHCIASVNNQTYKEIEHIIVDGASKDNTLEIIKSMPNRVSKMISEPDKGIYDAMNKGITISSGVIVAILNSDDLFIDNYVVEKVMDVFKATKSDCVYADLLYVDRVNINQVVRHWKTREYKHRAFYLGWHPAHPSFFLKKNIYEQYGVFDLTFALAADFELMLRMLEKYQITSVYLPFPLVKMRLGGATNKSIANIYHQNIECIKAFRKNGLDVGILYPVFRLIPKIKQFFT